MSASASSGPQLPGGQGRRGCVFENGLDRPGGLDGVLAGEQRPVTRQSISEEGLVLLLLVRPGVEQHELTLVAGEFLARTLDPGREGDDPGWVIADSWRDPLPTRSR